MINSSRTSFNTQPHEDRMFEHLSNNSASKTALDPKGRLVHENPIQAAASGIIETGKDVVNLKTALVEGKANDHSLGRLNDLGLKLGAVGIASYLFTRRNTPKAKLMEFAGAGVFIAMMSLWQKIFIAAPIKMRFGVDINQKYVDSFGRRKEFGLDNQYKPALRTKEEKDQLADRMGLPKDMEFRGEYAEEKERRVTLQGRTLNMLTAGVATPVLTALICNRIEKYADGAITKADLKKAQSKAENFASAVKSTASNPLFNPGSENIIKQYSRYTGNVDDDLFRRLSAAFNPVNAVENGKLTKNIPDLTDKIASDLKALFSSSIDEKTAAADVLDIFAKHSREDGSLIIVKALNAEAGMGVTNVSIQKSDLENAVANVIKKVKNGEIAYTGSDIMDAISKEKGLSVSIDVASSFDRAGLEKQRFRELREQGISADKIRRMFAEGTDDVLNARIKEASDTVGSATVKRTLSAIPADLTSEAGKKTFAELIEQSKKKFFPSFMEKVKENHKTARTLGAAMSNMDGIVKSLDNSFGKEYFNIVECVFDVMKPSKDELNRLRSNADYAAQYLQEAFSTIAADDDKYRQLLSKLQASPVISEAKRSSFIETLFENARKVFDTASGELDPSFKNLKELTEFGAGKTTGFIGDLEKYAAEAIPGIDATKNRVLLALDFEKRNSQGLLKEQWLKAKAVDPSISESFETFVSDCRKILYKSTPGDFANTHNIKGNGSYYEALHRALFVSPMSDVTVDAIKADKTLLDKLDEMRVSLTAIGSKGWGIKRGGDKFFVSDYVNTSNVINGDIIENKGLRSIFDSVLAENDAIKYQKIGKPLKNFTFENAGQIFNSKTWMRIFAPVAGVLIAATLLSQIFIGRDKDQHLYMNKNQNPGAVNGNQ